MWLSLFNKPFKDKVNEDIRCHSISGKLYVLLCLASGKQGPPGPKNGGKVHILF